MFEQLLQSLTVKDLMILLGVAITTWATSREALRHAKAANRRLDELLNGRDGRQGLPERVTRLEENRKTLGIEIKHARDLGHDAINIGAALAGYTDHAIDIVADAVGKTLPHPKLPKLRGRWSEEQQEGDGA